MDRECNARYKAPRGFKEDTSNMEKYLEREQDEAGTDGDTFSSAKAKVYRIASDIDGVRKRSKGAKDNQKDAVKR